MKAEQRGERDVQIVPLPVWTLGLGAVALKAGDGPELRFLAKSVHAGASVMRGEQ